MKIGQRIKAERESRNPPISRRKLAEMARIPYPTLAGLENGDQDSSTQLHKIAEALGVRTSWLETGDGPKYLSDPVSQTPTNLGDGSSKRPINVTEISPPASRNLRLDPVMLRNGFGLVNNFLIAGNRRGVFRTPDDLDLLAAACDYLVSHEQSVLDWIGAEVDKRVRERGEVNETGSRKVGNKKTSTKRK